VVGSSQTQNWKRFLYLGYVACKVKDYGIINTIRIAFARVSKKITRIKLPGCKRLHTAIDRVRYKGRKQDDVLYAFYDLQVSANTFDIILFLILAEHARISLGCNALHIIIVPELDEGYSKLKTYKKIGSKNFDLDYMRWREKNILIPCCFLLPNIKKVTSCISRAEAQAFESLLVKHIFPDGYSVRFPIESYSLNHIINSEGDLPTLQSGSEAQRIINDWITTNTNERKIITITLRESYYEQKRNSNIKDWGEFARSLDHNKYLPVIIRDAETVFTPIPNELNDLVFFNEVIFNIELRAALYELSYLNMLVNNGPVLVARWLKDSKSITFKMIVEESGGAVTESHFRSLGLNPGSQYQPNSPFHNLIWEDDNYNVIVREFEKMCELIEKSLGKKTYEKMF